MALTLRQTSSYEGNDYWRWAVWVDGPEDEIGTVESVVYTLHPTFSDPIRRVTDRASRFRLETTGWGSFRLYATIVYADGSTQQLQHDVGLSYPRGQEPPPQPAPEPESGAKDARASRTPGRQADGVFEGGGPSIFAFAGALAAAEEAGITEWVDVVGSSGGAIVAALLAVGYTPGEVKTILLEADYRRFLDSRFGILGSGWSLFRRSGMAEGEYLRAWLESRFEEKLGKRNPTFADVVHQDRRTELSPVARYRLHLVASDITAGRMIVLPDDIEYYEDARGRPFRRDDFPLVEAVRMSMSVPFAFTPVVIYRAGNPYCIVDGRLLSTFPIWLLDTHTPTRPTWGFHVHGGSGSERLPYRRLSRGTFSALGVSQAMISSVVEAWDPRYTSSDTVSRSISIETREIGSERRNLSKAQVESLYSWGYEATRSFFSVPREYFNSVGVGPSADLSSIAAS